MDYDKFETGDGMEVRTPKTKDCQTCSACGGGCSLEPSPDAGLGVRVLFVCPEHGARSIVNPFGHKRCPQTLTTSASSENPEGRSLPA